ncbi:MAG: GIY-YIG nuclease family protein [Promethearchaeota archaeon]
MTIFYVYILETEDKNGNKQYYTGYTNDIERRLREHIRGRGAKFCRGKKVNLKYLETFTNRSAAMKRELEIKSLSRKEKLELIKTLEK